MKRVFYAALYCLVMSTLYSQAQIEKNLVGDWNFTPPYSLERKAYNIPGPMIAPPKTPYTTLSTQAYPFLFHGEEPTQRMINFLPADQLPQGAFSIEMWLIDHVNQPVGALVTVKGRDIHEEPDWLLGYYEGDVIFTLITEDSPQGTLLHTEAKLGWKKYWHHLVATYDEQHMQLFYNGTLVKQTAVEKRVTDRLQHPELEMAAYLQQEPYMDLGNLVRSLRLYDCALNQEQVIQRFESLKDDVENGILYPGLFHYNAGPYLHYATPHSINLIWETDRPARAIISYGQQLPLTQQIVLEKPKTIQERTLEGLEAETSYFYDIQSISEEGDTISSGILTFSTAVRDSSSFSFALIGDTEARAHVNDRLAKLIWDERPNFALNLGDLTDGGFQPHKFEWNYEYFAGMRQLHSRIPVFPVAGNGEADLFWYKQYHKLPAPEAYYSFRYGNAEFFMLNSNEKAKEFAPGGLQYVWLENALKNSTATWKFVAHHHAPFSADEDDYGNAWEGPTHLGDEEVRQIVPLYEKYGVTMVFFGHLHTYQRTMPIDRNLVNEKNGVIYVQCGGGGGNLEDFAPARAWFSAKTYRGHHYATIAIQGKNLSYRVFDTEGRMRDFLELKKP